jgi:dihydrofolate reductase
VAPGRTPTTATTPTACTARTGSYYESITDGFGCGIVGRNMYDAAGAWGGTNPFPGTLIVLTHRTEDQPDPSAGFLFVDGFDAALMKARELAGDSGSPSVVAPT